MKQIVKFPLFGDETDYLVFDLGKLMRMQQLTERKTLAAVVEPLANGDFSLEYIVGGIKIGLEECYQKSGKDLSKVQELMEQSFENPEISITNYINLLAAAINATGLFKRPAGPTMPPTEAAGKQD